MILLSLIYLKCVIIHRKDLLEMNMYVEILSCGGEKNNFCGYSVFFKPQQHGYLLLSPVL